MAVTDAPFQVAVICAAPPSGTDAATLTGTLTPGLPAGIVTVAGTVTPGVSLTNATAVPVGFGAVPIPTASSPPVPGRATPPPRAKVGGTTTNVAVAREVPRSAEGRTIDGVSALVT